MFGLCKKISQAILASLSHGQYGMVSVWSFPVKTSLSVKKLKYIYITCVSRRFLSVHVLSLTYNSPPIALNILRAVWCNSCPRRLPINLFSLNYDTKSSVIRCLVIRQGSFDKNKSVVIDSFFGHDFVTRTVSKAVYCFVPYYKQLINQACMLEPHWRYWPSIASTKLISIFRVRFSC